MRPPRSCSSLPAGLVGLLALLSAGCDLGIDPDTLVRDLRVLGARTGDPAPGSVADIGLMNAQLPLQLLIAAPTGPARRVTSPRPVRVDLSLCLTPQSLLVPGAVDPACVSRAPRPADVMPLVCPPADQPLFPLAVDADADAPLVVPQGPILSCLQERLGGLLTGGTGGTGGGLPTTGVLEVRLPMALRARAGGSDEPLDSESAFFFPRLLIPLGGAPPPPNKNPVLLPLRYSYVEDDPAPQELQPCPAQGACTPLVMRRDHAVFFSARAQPGSAETYVPLDQSGRESATEQLRFAWFSTDGQFNNERTGEKLPQTRFENVAPYAAPDAVDRVQLWVVVQDGRGGSDWQRYEIALTNP